MSKVHEGLSPSTYENPLFNQANSQETLHQIALEDSYREVVARKARKEQEIRWRMYWQIVEVMSYRFGEFFWAEKLRQGLEKPLPSLRQIEVFNDHFGGDHERLESVIRARENQLMYAWRDYEQRLEGFGLEKDDFTTVKDLFSTMMKKMRYHIQKHSEHKDEPFRVSEIPERDFRK